MTAPITFDISNDKAPASAAPKRRGRPPGSTNKAKTAPSATDAATLKQALATMESLYSVTTAGLLMFGLTETATAWAASTEDLTKTNEDALKAAPRLAKAIANAGSVGGATTFVVAHVMAIAGVMRIASNELAARRQPGEEDAEA